MRIDGGKGELTTLRITISLMVCFGCLTHASRSHAQLAPEIGYVHPAGIQAGTMTEVTIGGYDWTPDMELFSHDPRVKLELIGSHTEVLITEPPYWFGAKARGYAWPLPREFRARISAAADLPPGLIHWQAANANGVSPVGVLQISNVPQFLETASPNEPQLLPQLPIAVSGQIRRIEEVDRYRIRPQSTGPITIELLARQLNLSANPLALHGILKVHDDAGRPVVDAAAPEGLDLSVTFAAAAHRDYILSLHDLDFAGDRSYVYQLVITPGPAVATASPSAGKRGETRLVEFIGWGLATGTAQLESVTREVTFPADPAVTSFDYVLKTVYGNSKPFSFLMSEFQEQIAGTLISDLPSAVSGQLEVQYGSAVYPVTFKKDDVWLIGAKSRTTRLPLDLELSIVGPDGKEVAAADDSPSSTDAELLFTVPNDGLYQLIVTDRSGRSGDRSAGYRLSIERPRPGCTFNVPDHFSLAVGTSAKLPISVLRKYGWKGPISLTFDGLPSGVVVPANLVIAEDKNELAVEVSCAADAATSASLVRISSSIMVDGSIESRPVKSLVLAAIMKPQIRITPEGLDDVSKVRRGSTHLFPLKIERFEGFAGEITLEMTAKQQRHRQGLSSDELIVDASANRVEYPIFVPEWMETTKTSRMILNGAIRVPDPQGNVRTLLQKMELRLGILPEGALMKLAHTIKEVQAKPGHDMKVPVTISRAPEFREEVRVEVVPNPMQSDIFSATPVILPAGETSAVLRIHFADKPTVLGEQSIMIRATALQKGERLVKSETSVVVNLVH